MPPDVGRGGLLRQLVASERWQLGLLVSIVVVFLAGSSAPTPLYATYQRLWDFSLVTTTVVFGAYALAVLTGLLILGRVSDSVGRRPVILVATAVQVVAMVVFTVAAGVPALYLARVLQGLATGAALGAIGSAMLQVSPRLGGTANAAAPGFGTALGAIGSALIVTRLPAPTRTIYVVLALLLAVQLLAVALTVPADRPGSPIPVRLVPTLRIPALTRPAIVAVSPALFAVWALAGLYGSLGPALLSALTGRSTVLLGGLGLFILAGVGALSTIALRSVAATTVLRVGLSSLALGVLGVLTAVLLRSPTGFVVGTVVAGVGFGSGFQGGLRTVLASTRPPDRVGVLSTLFVVSYLGLGLPAVLAGWLVVHGHPLLTVTIWYGAFLLLLAAAAAVSLHVARRSRSSTRPGGRPRAVRAARAPR